MSIGNAKRSCYVGYPDPAQEAAANDLAERLNAAGLFARPILMLNADAQVHLDAPHESMSWTHAELLIKQQQEEDAREAQEERDFRTRMEATAPQVMERLMDNAKRRRFTSAETYIPPLEEGTVQGVTNLMRHARISAVSGTDRATPMLVKAAQSMTAPGPEGVLIQEALKASERECQLYALLMAAGEFQGVTARTRPVSMVIAVALDVPHPLQMSDLVERAKEAGFNTAELWPWSALARAEGGQE